MKGNELKKSTYLALVGVVISAVALATATYAWFVNNQLAQVETISFTSESTSDLLIAAHNGTATKADQTGLQYKSFLTNEDIKDYLEPVKDGLRGVSTVDTQAFFTNEGMIGEGGAPDSNGFDSTNKAEFFKKVEDGRGMYLALPVWFRSSTDADVYLRGGVTATSGTSIKAQALPETPKGALLTRAIVVGFRPQGGTAVLYEPDPATEGGGYTRRNTTRFEGGPDPIPDKYGIAALNGDNKIAAIAPQDRKQNENLFVNTDDLQRLTKAQIDGLSPKPQPLFRVMGGAPVLVTIYVWLDGMDYDCLSDISGGLLSVRLSFIAAETE